MAQTCSTCTRPASHVDADDRPTVYCGRCAAKWGQKLGHRMKPLLVKQPSVLWEEPEKHPPGAVRWLEHGSRLFNDCEPTRFTIPRRAHEPVLIAGFASKLHGGMVAVIDASGRAGFVRVPNLLTEKRRKERLNNVP